MRILNKKYWPYRTTINHPAIDDFDEMRSWTNERATEVGWYPISLDNGKMDVYFKDEQMLTMFTMKWA